MSGVTLSALSTQSPALLFTPTGCLALAAALFAIGVVGVLARRNILVVLLSIEIMLNAVNLAFVALSRYHVGSVAADTPLSAALATSMSGQVFALFVIAVAAAEAAVGLAIVITFFRNKESVDTRDLALMRQ